MKWRGGTEKARFFFHRALYKIILAVNFFLYVLIKPYLHEWKRACQMFFVFDSCTLFTHKMWIFREFSSQREQKDEQTAFMKYSRFLQSFGIKSTRTNILKIP